MSIFAGVSGLRTGAIPAAIGSSWWKPASVAPEGWEPKLDLEQLLSRELQSLVPIVL